jgi:hypothetical protein
MKPIDLRQHESVRRYDSLNRPTCANRLDVAPVTAPAPQARATAEDSPAGSVRVQLAGSRRLR